MVGCACLVAFAAASRAARLVEPSSHDQSRRRDESIPNAPRGRSARSASSTRSPFHDGTSAELAELHVRRALARAPCRRDRAGGSPRRAPLRHRRARGRRGCPRGRPPVAVVGHRRARRPPRAPSHRSDPDDLARRSRAPLPPSRLPPRRRAAGPPLRRHRAPARHAPHVRRRPDPPRPQPRADRRCERGPVRRRRQRGHGRALAARAERLLARRRACSATCGSRRGTRRG